MSDNKINKCYFNLVNETIKHCFNPISKINTKKQTQKIKNIRINFAKSKMVILFCDCSYNFEYDKLKNLIIKKNLCD